MLFGNLFLEHKSKEERNFTVKNLDLRNLAHLGDAVFDLYQRERQLLDAVTVNSMHKKVVNRVNSKAQARLLHLLRPQLTEEESDIVRRARNLKTAGFRKNVEQSTLRQATAFEALVGYLYLTDETRLQSVLNLTESDLHTSNQSDDLETKT
jgi:ribonuclease-3 family protein